MPGEFPILPFVNELEEAGWLGLAAGSALTLFNLPGTGPGALSSTDAGFVWTKKLLDSTLDQEFNLGIGKLKLHGALLSVSLGVQVKDGIPSFIDIMISFLGEGISPSVFLEIDPKVAILADKIVKLPHEDPPTPGEVVTGYTNPGDPLRIPFPNGAIEFNFRFDKEKGVFSSLQLYGSIGGILNAASGIIDFDLDRVVVFPKLSGLGLYVDKLFIDLTDSGTTSFSGLFPEVYDPTWKGVGASDITFLYPIDLEEKEFIAAGVRGFLLGFDGKFSASFNFAYTNPDPTARIKYATAEIEIRNNEFLRAEMHLGFDLKRALEKVDPSATDKSAIDNDGTDSEKHVADETIAKLDDERPNFDIGGVIDARVDFVWHHIDGDEIIGFDVIAEGISIDGAPAGFVISGNAAKMIFWIAGGGFGVSLLHKGIKEDSTFKKVIGVTLLLLVVADIVKATWEGKPLLPQLHRLTIDKFGFRYVYVSSSDGTVTKYYEVVAGWRIAFTVDSIIIKALESLASLLLGTLGFAGNLFGETLDTIRIKGEIDIEMDNLIYGNKDLPPEINVLFEQRSLHVRAKKLPEIVFEEETASGSRIPKPMGGVELVTRPSQSNPLQTQYGIAIKLEGLASADFSMQIPASGIVIFFYPECGIEILPVTTILPKFTFVIPRALLAEGIIDLNKPLPSFGGEQNRIKLEVGAVYASTENGMKEYLKFTNYKYRFGGEVAWGEVLSSATDPPRKYGFLFVEVHYEGSTPLFVVGAVGVYGIGLLFGKNIRPGVQGSDNSAMGIANWIIGKRVEGVEDEEIFKNVRDWPNVPAADGSTWHPAIHYDADNEEYDDLYTIGLTTKIGSAFDQGDTYKGEAIVMVGFPEWWVAVGGIVTFKKINAELIVIVVYDSDSLAIKIIFELKADEEGSVVRGIIPLEFGHTFSSPKRTWLYIGHYLESKGSPVLFRFLKGLFTVKGYFDYDTDGLLQFGLVPIGDFPRPDITGRAIGFGVMVQWGPKRLGPSAVNITLFGAMGLNVAHGSEPRISFGEIFIGGYIQLKVLFVKAKLELLLLLGGMVTDEGHRFVGIFMVRLNMPWPIPDWKYSTDFVIQSSDFLPLPDPIVSNTASGLYRMEPTALNLLIETPVVLPIDAAISLSFDKPIYGIISGAGGSENETSLLLNDENPEDDKISEILETDYMGLKYIVHFTHVIESISLRRRTLNGSLTIFIPEVPATWEAPLLYEGGSPDLSAGTHQTLFLNALMPPHLQFAGEQLGQFITWVETTNHIYPCEYPGLYCINQDPRPLLQTMPIPSLHFETPYGDVDIRDDGILETEENDGDYSGQLGWTTNTPPQIILPYKTHYNVPFPDKVQLSFSFVNTKPGEGHGKLAELIHELKLEFTIKLRGAIDAFHFNISLRVDNAVPCGWMAELTNDDSDPAFLSIELLNSGCADDARFDFTFEMRSVDIIHPIDFIKSKGIIFVFSQALMTGTQAFEAMADVYALLIPFRLQLANLCLEDSHHPSLVWGQTTIGTGSTEEDPVDNLTNHLLFEPGCEYTVACNLHSFVTTYHVGTDGTELVDEKEITIVLPEFRFHTESAPSQNIRQYIGFTYPMEGMQAPYASSLAPMLTFKYQGLILKIFKKHYGADVLIPLLVDMDGQEVQSAIQQTIEINSGGADEALEDLLSHCLEEAEEYTHLQLSVWDRSLFPDTRYSLQLKDIHLPTNPSVPYTISFKTSRFPDLIGHIDYIELLFDTSATEPLLNPASFASDMNDFIEAIITHVIPSYDDAIEKFYLNFLGVESGRLSPVPDQDFVSFIAGFDGNGDSLIWAIVIELIEPVLGKEGVTAGLSPLLTDSEGIFISSNGLVILRDVSGSRLIMFRRDSAGLFIPFSNTVSLDFVFDPREALRSSVAIYVRNAFPYKDDSEQATLINDQFNELLAISEVSEAMVVVSKTVNIIIPFVP